MLRQTLLNLYVNCLKFLNLYPFFLLRNSKSLKELGWLNSLRTQTPIDANGNPIPWLTYPAIHFLKGRITAEMTIFEYGCGNSTLWWAKHAKEVTACEHNKSWFKKIDAFAIPQLKLFQVDLEYGKDPNSEIEK